MWQGATGTYAETNHGRSRRAGQRRGDPGLKKKKTVQGRTRVLSRSHLGSSEGGTKAEVFWGAGRASVEIGSCRNASRWHIAPGKKRQAEKKRGDIDLKRWSTSARLQEDLGQLYGAVQGKKGDKSGTGGSRVNRLPLCLRRATAQNEKSRTPHIPFGLKPLFVTLGGQIIEGGRKELSGFIANQPRSGEKRIGTSDGSP